MIKYFRFSSGLGTWEYILWGISWANLMMLSATVPSFDKKKGSDDEVIKDFDESNIENFFGF